MMTKYAGHMILGPELEPVHLLSRGSTLFNHNLVTGGKSNSLPTKLPFRFNI